MASHGEIRRSVVNVVDLAGSERLSTINMNNNMNMENNNSSSMETGYINKSLFQFSNVIAKLSELSKNSNDNNNNNSIIKHIPYRDSKLTRLL